MYVVSICKILNNSLGCMLQSVEILEENKIFLYKKGSILDIVGYSDVEWAGSKKDKRSTKRILHVSCRKSCYMEE